MVGKSDMKDIETLSVIRDSAAVDNIRRLTAGFVAQVKPLKVVLFGSFADGTYTDESDYDFYLVVDDGRSVSDATDAAYSSATRVKNRPVDIVVGTNSRFEARGRLNCSFSVENEAYKNGVLLYDRLEESAQRIFL